MMRTLLSGILPRVAAACALLYLRVVRYDLRAPRSTSLKAVNREP